MLFAICTRDAIRGFLGKIHISIVYQVNPRSVKLVTLEIFTWPGPEETKRNQKELDRTRRTPSMVLHDILLETGPVKQIEKEDLFNKPTYHRPALYTFKGKAQRTGILRSG